MLVGYSKHLPEYKSNNTFELIPTDLALALILTMSFFITLNNVHIILKINKLVTISKREQYTYWSSTLLCQVI